MKGFLIVCATAWLAGIALWLYSAVLWMLSAWTDMIDPPDRKFTKEEWEAAARAFRETLESFARGER
jgi:hypothetical protein